MEIPEAVRAFRLLEGAGLDQKASQLVLTGVDYKQTADLLKQMGSALRFFGKQSLAKETISHSAIKVEPAYVTESYQETDQNQEDLFTKGYSQSGFNWARKRSFHPQNIQQSAYRRSTGIPGKGKGRSAAGYDELRTKRVNPIGPDGYPLRCRSCRLIRHLRKDCPNSYETKARKAAFEEAVLFTGNQEVQVLVAECMYSAVLDSACSSTVAGEEWLFGLTE